MKTYTSTLHVDAPPEVAFACVTDPEVLNAGGGFRYTLLEGNPGGEGTTIRYEMRVLGLRLGGTLTLRDVVPGERVTFDWHGTERYALGGLVGRWTFTPHDGGTTITIRSEFDTRVPVLHAAMAWATIRSFRRTELPTFKEAIEARARALHPAA